MSELMTRQTAGIVTVQSDVDIQIATAHRYPRDVSKAIANVRALAMMDEDVAESCFYHLERKAGKESKDYTYINNKGEKIKVIEGPSIRLAEMMANNWGNLRVATRIVEVGERSVIVEAMAHDLESNLASMATKTRSIWGNYGRYSQEMIEVNTAAALAIARREAILHVVPRVFADKICDECKKFCVGGGKLNESRAKAIQTFARHGVKAEQIEAKLGKSIDAIDADDLIKLRGMLTAIKEGHTTIDIEFFAKPQKQSAAQVAAEKFEDQE